jgi:hypothetical protein
MCLFSVCFHSHGLKLLEDPNLLGASPDLEIPGTQNSWEIITGCHGTARLASRVGAMTHARHYPIWWPGGPFFCHRSPPPEFRRAPPQKLGTLLSHLVARRTFFCHRSPPPEFRRAPLKNQGRCYTSPPPPDTVDLPTPFD